MKFMHPRRINQPDMINKQAEAEILIPRVKQYHKERGGRMKQRSYK